MNEQKMNQPPAPGTDTKSPASTNPAASKTPAEKMLPSGYLKDGALLDEEGVMRSEYIGGYAEEIASVGSVATLPKNGLIRPQPGRVRFACWDSPKPLYRTEAISARAWQPRQYILSN